MRISDWSSDVCSSDLNRDRAAYLSAKPCAKGRRTAQRSGCQSFAGNGKALMQRGRSTIAQDRSPLRTTGTPIIMVILGSVVTILPMIAVTTSLPPFGLLLLLAWRLLRPELWPLWIAVPLGLFDDIMSGQPLGSAMRSEERRGGKEGVR